MEGMDDPFKPGHMSATIKQDGKDGTWLVFHGAPAAIRKQIIETFDMDPEETKAPLFDLINEATRIYKSTGNLSSALGGRVVGGTASTGEASAASGSAWDRANAGEQAPPVDINVVRLTKAIEEATDVDSLKELYARNAAHFGEGSELLTLWQAKGKALSA